MLILDKKQVLGKIKKLGKIKTQDLVREYNISRQYANKLIRNWVNAEELYKIGSTRNAIYVTHEFVKNNPDVIINKFTKRFLNKNLEEHKVLAELEDSAPFIIDLKNNKENIYSIFYYAFSEMLNNAIEHSHSKYINIEVFLQKNILTFTINDYGIGVYKNIMKSRHLKSELEAIQDLLKGKLTTAPQAHSGEGIFFTSKVADLFLLNSFGNKLVIDNKIKDVFLSKPKSIKKGTKVTFSIDVNSKLHLNDIFKKYTDFTGDYGFDKTEVKIKLYTIGGVHVSRSQARRVLTGLEKFKFIILDFDKVPMVGQAFADEIFRVFQNKYPNIQITAINTVEAVQFMIDRVDNK